MKDSITINETSCHPATITISGPYISVCPASAGGYTNPMPSNLEQLLDASVKLGEWMSAALSDPLSCDEFKAIIMEWFEALAEFKVFEPLPSGDGCTEASAEPA